MTLVDYGDIWVCTDCYFAHHYGYHAGDKGGWFVGPDFVDEVECEPLNLVAEDFEQADNTCSNHNGDDETECSECGHKGWEDGLTDFTWSRCDGCGSHLGGSRSRLHLWKREEEHA